MRGPFSLVVAMVALLGCYRDGDRGGFGDPAPPLRSPSPAPGDPAPDQEAAEIVRVSAPGGFRYEPQALRVRAGGLTEFAFSNQDGREHTFVVGELAVVMLAGPGQTVRSTVAIDPSNTGRFAFFCSIGGHREAGMEGTIVVRAG